MPEKESPKSKGKTIVGNVGCGVAGLMLLGMLAGGGYLWYERTRNEAAAVRIERSILEQNGLLGLHELSFLRQNSETGKIHIEFTIEDSDKMARTISIDLTKDRIEAVLLRDRKTKETIEIKPENYIKQEAGFIPKFSVIEGQNPADIVSRGKVILNLYRQNFERFKAR